MNTNTINDLLKNQKSIFIREEGGDRFVSLEAINMFSFEINEEEKSFFVGVLYAHIGEIKIPIYVDDEGNRADLYDRLEQIVARFVSPIDFETLDDLMRSLNPNCHYDDLHSRIYEVKKTLG